MICRIGKNPVFEVPREHIVHFLMHAIQVTGILIEQSVDWCDALRRMIQHPSWPSEYCTIEDHLYDYAYGESCMLISTDEKMRWDPDEEQKVDLFRRVMAMMYGNHFALYEVYDNDDEVIAYFLRPCADRGPPEAAQGPLDLVVPSNIYI